MSELRQISEDIAARLRSALREKPPTLGALSHFQASMAMFRLKASRQSLSTALKPRMTPCRSGLWCLRDFDHFFYGETQEGVYRHWLYITTREAMDKVDER
ncbi:MAG: hypothetical protein RR831_18650 [Stenotrophomonas sp.]